MGYQSQNIRNIALMGHSGAGKSTLAETMIYESGNLSKRGTIETGTTLSDYRPIEKEKGKSVSSTLLHLDWRGTKVNLLDNPGTADFSGQAAESLQVADTALFVLNSESGLEVGTLAGWRMAEARKMPSFFVVNQVDSSKSDFQRTVDSVQERFGRKVVVMQFPYSEGEEFHAIIDVLKMTMYEFPEAGGKPDKLPIPDSQKARAELLHNELVEAIAENDETLLDLYFEHGELDEYQMRDGLQASLLRREIFPLFTVSAARNMGTGRVLGFIGNVLPHPGLIEAELESGEAFEINADSDPSLFCFKTVYEDHVGEVSFMKVMGGVVKPGMALNNHRTSGSLRLGSLYVNQGRKRSELSEAVAGDLVAAVKLKGIESGDTLSVKSEGPVFKRVTYPPTTIRSAIQLSREGEEDKLGSALQLLLKEDPSLIVEHSQELQQTILHALGEEHLNVVLYKLKEQFSLDLELVKPKIPYRETITRRADASYRHKKQSGGAGQFADVSLSIEPWEEGMPERSDLTVRSVEKIDLEWGGTLVFQNCIVGGVLDSRFIPAVLKGILEKMERGPLTESRVIDIRVSVYDGSMHPVDSNDAAFKTAAAMAFKRGFLEAGPQLMEPLYQIEIALPSDYMGDVMSDLSSRRGQILGMDAEGSIQIIKAVVPLKELDYYTTRLKSLTQGSASYTRTFHSYGALPADLQQKVVNEQAEMIRT
ncbi:MAG TPA: elongation factor G [Balneolaceae bacterium]|nr:elongation factor G [Balneolaceae bacterium]